jgi:hypothetical protein
MRSSCGGLKSEAIRGAVFSSSMKIRLEMRLSRCEQNKDMLTLRRFQKTVCEGKCNKTSEGEDEERKELALQRSLDSSTINDDGMHLNRTCSS